MGSFSFVIRVHPLLMILQSLPWSKFLRTIGADQLKVEGLGVLLKCKRGFEDFSTFGAFLTVCHCYGVHIGFVFQHPYLCHKRFSAQITKNYPEWFWKRCFSISRGQRGPKGSIVGCMSYFHVILQSCLCVVLFMARGAGKLLGFFNVVSCMVAK